MVIEVVWVASVVLMLKLRVLVLDRVMRVEHKAMYRRIELAFQGVAPVEFGSSRNGSPM